MAQPIQPLRIQKTTPLSSPSKSSGAAAQRPLSELSSIERRRNSPSYNQNNKMMLHNDSSPFDSSPFASNSPRLYWQNRDSVSPSRENRNPLECETSPSPTKRSSIENLKRASRVKNSNMFAREHKREYDPTSSPMIERPLASGRPLSVQVNGNAYGGKGLEGLRKDNTSNNSRLPLYSPTRPLSKMEDILEPQKSPARDQASPGKSSLSARSRYKQAQAFDPENGVWSEEEEAYGDQELPPGKSPRHFKSVTFDVAPPQVNEYEMTTPDPSSIASGSREGSYESADGEDESFDRESSIDRDDSFDASLEDTDKTPVVLPEDWRFMSPDAANENLAASVEDPFEGGNSSPAPTARPGSAARMSPARTDSQSSSGERRPLPPLPAAMNMGMPVFPRARSDSNGSLSATAERLSTSQRTLPSPPKAATISKSDIQSMSGSSMSIEDRLRLMMINDDDGSKQASGEQRERRMRRAGVQKNTLDGLGGTDIKIFEDHVEQNEEPALAEMDYIPKISRESILRKVKIQVLQKRDASHEPSSPSQSFCDAREELSQLDPDTPLPSLEGGSRLELDEDSIVIKEEIDEESDVDVYAIPDMYRQHLQAESLYTATEDDAGRVHSTSEQGDDDDESHYSSDPKDDQGQGPQSNSATEDEGPPTPRAHSPINRSLDSIGKPEQRMSLPEFASMLSEQHFSLGLQSYMTPSPPLGDEPVKKDPSKEVQRIEIPLQRPQTPEEQLFPPKFPGYGESNDDEPKTPESVIRHSIASEPAPDSPSIPEPVATIKAPGGRLKTRPSITPSDAVTMAEARRQVSGEVPDVPAIPQRHLARPAMNQEAQGGAQDSGSDAGSEGESISSDPAKPCKRKSSLVQLDMPIEKAEERLSFGIDKEFDRVIEAQKKGYLMRQNTKMVVASSASHESAPDDVGQTQPRGTRSAGNSPRKASHTQTWTTEPWNGKIRRKSIRQSAGSPQKRVPSGAVPPLPGQVSNVTTGLDSVQEDQITQTTDDFEDGVERGRLFVKVVSVKELDLPLPKGERSYFALTLDNGLHCVTTSWLELGKTAPIGQEFELVVLNDLEFQLTLQTKLEEPKARPQPVIESPTKTPRIQKPSTFSRVFQSPRKRKELEMKQQEEAQRLAKQKQLDAQTSRRAAQPSAWDLQHNLVAKDGSFARSYVCLKDHETQAYGQPYIVDIPCFNEWATAEPGSSVKSKSGAVGGVHRKAPYRIGKLELQLLFVPKPPGASEDDMPKSMNACIRDLKEAELAFTRSWEGCLSQQGGDCPFWRRRFFMLDGSKLTAYHEATRQPRATINLAKASKLIDDKSALMKKEVSGKGGSRRKSAFAEEEEGYMFVEEGFRVRFANGETIDFYADSAAEKDGWMKALADIVGKEPKTAKSWTDLVLAKRKAAAQRASRVEQGQTKPSQALKSALPTSAGGRQGSHQHGLNSAPPPPPLEKDARHMHQTAEQRRQKTRSMIF